MDYGYNSLDQLSSFTYPDGEKVDYYPDLLGRPTRINPIATSVLYHAHSGIYKLRYANGVELEQHYDSRLRLQEKKVRKYNSSAYYYRATLDYDDAGNLTSVNDQNAQNDRTLNYDAINRLTTANGPWGYGSIRYDGRGNITYKKLGGRTQNYAYDRSKNRLTGVSGSTSRNFSYDTWGNVTHNGKDQFTYDDAQNMACSNCSTSKAVRYQYDTDNMRVKQLKNGLNTYFVYARNGNLIMEYTPGKGEYKIHGYLGGKQIATVTQTKPNLDMDKDGRSDASEIGQNPGTVATTHKLEFVNTDAVGSPIVATNFDQNYASQPYNSRQGTKVWTQNYYPYGERREKWSANYGKDHTQWFGGKPLDTDTGLSYFGARFYDPAVGRFMGIDPVQPNLMNIHHQNRYNYANNNPYKYVDPDGRYADLAVEAVSISIGVASLGNNLWNGQWGDAGIDALGIVGDGLLAVVPFAPGGFGLGIKASRHADDVVQATKDGVKGRFKPLDNAEGAHSAYRRNGETGEITHYIEYGKPTHPKNPHKWEEKKRYDGGESPSHYNKATGEEVTTPHIHDRNIPGGVRNARANEIPGGK